MFYSRFIASACKLLMALHFLGGGALVFAQSSWLTVAGDPGDSQNDVVQIDPTSRAGTASLPTFNVRVSRAVLRISWDDIPYRSYASTVAIDCAENSGRYTEISFYMMPLWEGQSHKTISFSAAESRPMRFRDIEPSPTSRIVRAACTSANR